MNFSSQNSTSAERREIRKRALNRIKGVFRNRKELATDILSNLFERASKKNGITIRLYIKNLHQELFNDSYVVSNIYEFLQQPNNTLLILLDERNEDREKRSLGFNFSNLIISSDDDTDKIIVRRFRLDQYKAVFPENGYFVVSSDGMYRIEKRKNDSNKASYSYSDQHRADIAIFLFDKVFDDQIKTEEVNFSYEETTV